MNKGEFKDKKSQMSTLSLFLWLTNTMGYSLEDLDKFDISDIISISAIESFKYYEAEKKNKHKHKQKSIDLFSNNFLIEGEQ